MSQLLNLNPPHHEDGGDVDHHLDEMDALNNETFGDCDEEEWGKESENLAGFFAPNDDRDTPPENLVDGLLGHLQMKKMNTEPDPFSNYEDIVKKSISNFILDDDLYDEDDDICADFASYELDTRTTNELSLTTKPNKMNKTIDLGSLRPPSPSILPFDDPIMSSVWRPLSPELNAQQQQKQQQQSPKRINTSPPKQEISKIMTLEELEKSLTSINGNNDSVVDQLKIPVTTTVTSTPKVMRLEELEAQLMEPSPKQPLQQHPSTDNFNGSFSGQQQQSASKMPKSIMEIAAMSLNKMSLTPQSPTRLIQPPPGLGSNHFPSLPSVVPSHVPEVKATTSSSKEQIQSQMAMANAMASALAGMSQLSSSTQQPSLSLMPMSINPLILDPRVQQEQQRIINRIITPAQAQRCYPNNYTNHNRNQDRFAGFMTQKEKDWLVKIFRLQCKVNDPYVEDYYEVNFKVKKATQERRTQLAKQHNRNMDDAEIDSIIDSEPMIVLPELAKVEEDKPKYIQFDNALGKIQVSNSKCPRKLLDVNVNVNPDKSSVLYDDSYSRLMKIERLYEHLLNIEDEDKRMPILPPNVMKQHLDKREQLCRLLFQGLVRPIDQSDSTNKETIFILIKRTMPTLKRLELEVDPDVLNVEKGMVLIFRSLFLLRDETQLTILLASLLKGCNYRKSILEFEPKTTRSYGSMLIKALCRISKTKNLIYIGAAIDDIEVITNHKVTNIFMIIFSLLYLNFL